MMTTDTQPHLLLALRDRGGFYRCPHDRHGRRLGPLVGYAGRDPAGRQYVGEIYLNFARAERDPALLARFADAALQAADRRLMLAGVDSFVGAPEGGKALAYQCALQRGAEYLYPEKRITALATTTSRETSDLVFARHEPEPGQRLILVEDVCNNFSTAAALIDLVESHAATVVGIVCLLNRSTTVVDIYEPRPGRSVPVVAAIRLGIEQYRQDDPAVAEDVAAGRVVWSPKKQWGVLRDAMDAAPQDAAGEMV